MGAAALIPALGLGINAVGLLAQKKNADQTTQVQIAQLKHQRDATIAETNRQEGEARRIATEQISDRIAQSNQQLGTARVTAGERGASASTMQSFARAIGFAEGLDINRIRTQNIQNQKAGEATKKNAEVGVFDSINIVNNQKSVSMTNSTLNFIGSGIQIASNAYSNSMALNAAQNLKAS